MITTRSQDHDFDLPCRLLDSVTYRSSCDVHSPTATDQSAGANCAFVPVERELVFDIDLTDYDDVRACGKEGHICSKCWPLMAIAVQVTAS